MAVSSVVTLSGPYTTNGVTTTFPFTFKAMAEAEVRVFRADDDGVETTISAGAYDVTLTDDGGSVVFTTAPASGDPLYIGTDPDYTQQITFENQGAFLPEVMNEAFDRAAVKTLDLKNKIDRAPVTPLVGSVDGQYPVVLPGGAWGFSTGTGSDAALRSDLASVADGKGTEVIADQLPYSDTIADDQREINRDRISAMRWVPKALRAGIRDRIGTTDLTAYIQNAIDAVPAGATLYFPGGLWRRDGTVTCSKTITIIGDPGHSDEDNSWDNGRGGTTFDCRHTTANAFTFSAPDTPNSRVSVTLRDFLVRGSRVSASGTTGHGIEVDGKNQAGTFVKLVMNNVHATEAPGTGLYLHGAVYGGSITDCSFFRNGKRGVLGLSEVDTTGEMLVNNLRCFQNGALAGDEEEGTGFIWLGGHIIGNLISCTDNEGSGALLGGGSIVINGLHVESNNGTAQVRLGKTGSGIVACVLTGLESSAGTDYTGAHVHITQYAKNIQLIGGFFGDTLGVGGKHILRDAGAEGLTFRGFGTSVPLVIDDNANDYQTTAVVQAFARLNTAGTNQTGDGTTVDFIPDEEVIDNYAALNIATGVFTAPFSGLYRLEAVIPLDNIGAGHNTGSTFLTATSYGRIIPMGNVGAMRTAGNTWSERVTAVIPMVQGDTAKLSFNVNGSTKTVGTQGGGTYGFLSVTSAH